MAAKSLYIISNFHSFIFYHLDPEQGHGGGKGRGSVQVGQVAISSQGYN